MNVVRSYSQWIVAMVGGICLVGAAVGMAQRQPKLNAVRAIDARELSSVFRTISKNALPSVVSIETRGKTVSFSGKQNPLGEGHPFGELFKNDPRFKEFFNGQQQPRHHTPRGMGSGFVIDSQGIILTNSHVVENAESIIVRFHDGKEFTAIDWKQDPRSDIAIIRIDAPKGLKALPLGDSDLSQIGDWVMAVGSPFGLEMSVTAGIISAKGRDTNFEKREDFIQTDAAINPGNSGGPLLNLNGEVIGVNAAISTRSGGYDGVSFTIPINMAYWVAEQLVEKGEVKRAYLGVTIQEIDDTLSKKLDVEISAGVVVSQVLEDSPAALAKIQTGDILVELNGKEIRSPTVLQGIVEQLDISKVYSLSLIRDGKRMTMDISFKEFPKDLGLSNTNGAKPKKQYDPKEAKPGAYERMGIELQELKPELAEQLGYDARVSGVVITKVDPESEAFLAGLRSGQIIEKVNDKSVTTLEEFKAATKDTSVEKGVLMLVRTPRSSRFVVIKAKK